MWWRSAEQHEEALAYSSIAHAGYLLMGVVVLNNEGIAAILLYFVIYLFMNLGAFYVVMLIGTRPAVKISRTTKGLAPARRSSRWRSRCSLSR